MTPPAEPGPVATLSPPGPAPAERGRVRRLLPETGLQAAIWALVLVCVLAPRVWRFGNFHFRLPTPGTWPASSRCAS